ncbi:MAG: HAD-IC family P-type ATPase, partial [bacterium]
RDITGQQRAQKSIEPDEILSWAASLEIHSEHILASAIRCLASEEKTTQHKFVQVQRHPGLGMEGTLEDSQARVLMGSARFLEQQGLEIPSEVLTAQDKLALQGSISILVATDNLVKGALVLQDSPRTEVKTTLHLLRRQGITRMILLTGDNKRTAEHVAAAVGIEESYADLLPEEKVERIKATQRQGCIVAMIGDGVNDSPSLAAADVGIAMGDTGTDIAADAAGVVLMGEKGFARLPLLIDASRRAMSTIRGNILWFGFVANLVAVVAAFTGVLSAIAAAVVHQLSSFLVLMSSLRLLKDWSLSDLESHRKLRRSPANLESRPPGR